MIHHFHYNYGYTQLLCGQGLVKKEKMMPAARRFPIMPLFQKIEKFPKMKHTFLAALYICHVNPVFDAGFSYDT